MKIKIAILSIIAALALPVAAQTSQQPTTPGDVVDNIGSYFTSFNTNLTWTNTPISIWTAANWQNNVNTSAELGLSYDTFRISPNLAVAPEGVIRNAGIAGTIVSGQVGVGLSFTHYDLKLTPYVDAGYSPQVSSALVEFGGRLVKKMTVSTHAGIGLGLTHYFHAKNQNTPTVNVFLGWDF